MLSLDGDAQKGLSASTTREESRCVVNHALEALKTELAFCVTGEPGIRKICCCIMYVILALLHRGTAVLYVVYRPKKMLIFLPGEDENSRVGKERLLAARTQCKHLIHPL